MFPDFVGFIYVGFDLVVVLILMLLVAVLDWVWVGWICCLLSFGLV